MILLIIKLASATELAGSLPIDICGFSIVVEIDKPIVAGRLHAVCIDQLGGTKSINPAPV